MRSRIMLAAAAAALSLGAAQLDAAIIYWQGGTGNLGDGNYSDGTNSNLSPGAADGLNIGNGGTANNSSAAIGIDALRIGHNEATLPGTGTVNISGGSVTAAGVTGLGAGPAGTVIVGSNADGTLNLSGGTLAVSNGAMFVGYDGTTDTATGAGTGTLNVSGTGALQVQLNRLGIGDGNAGAVTVSDSGSISISNPSGNADFILGVSAASTFSQSGGTVSVNRDAFVGRRDADGTSFALTNGLFSVTRNLIVADGTAGVGGTGNVLVDIDGGTLDVGNFISFGRNAATGATLDISGGTVDIGTDFNLATDESTNTTFNLSGGSVTTAAGADNNITIGLGASSNTTFNFTGGALTSGGRFLMGGATTVNAVAHHSAGTLTTGQNVVIADQGGTGIVYNLSGTGVINATTASIIGRQGSGTLNQTGGSATFSDGLFIGEDEGDTTALAASGLYEISAGSLNATGLTGNALAIGTAGTGELRIVGDDALVDLTGNLLVDNTAKGIGTLAFELESSDLLSLIDVSGTATFNAGARLVLDDSAAAPTQGIYDLVTATDIIDGGLSFSGPAGWGFQIVSGGNGEILQAVVPEPSALGLAASAGLLALRRRHRHRSA